MSQLVPCPSCNRHVRLTASSSPSLQSLSLQCPFCEAALDVAALSQQHAPRRGALQTGVKRAVVFAMGASMAAACGDDVGQAIYGAPVAPSESSSSSDAEATTEGVDSTSEAPTNVALYGGPPSEASSGDATSTLPSEPTDSVSDSSTTADSSASDAGGVGSEAPTDAGTSLDGDAGFDASIAPEPEPTVMALYGGPPQ